MLKEELKESTYTTLIKRIKIHREKIAKLTSTMGEPGNAENISFSLRISNETRLPVEVFRPRNTLLEHYPTIFHIPGSGYNTLIPYFAFTTCSQLAEHSGCQVIVINHRLAPENPFPDGQDDTLKVFCNLMEKARSLKIDTGNVALSGYSSGGTYAAWIVNQKNYKQVSSIKHLFLISPVLDLSGVMPRTKEAKEIQDHVVSQYFVKGMKEFYLYRMETLNALNPNPKLSPIFAPIKSNHPSTDILYGSTDRFLSDAKNYSSNLKEKTKVISKNFDKTCHDGFWHNIEMIRFMSGRAKDELALPVYRSLFPKRKKVSKEEDTLDEYTEISHDNRGSKGR
jgi:acetyl esterase/lipase